MNNGWKIFYTAKATLPEEMEKPTYAEMVKFLFGTLNMKWEDLKSMYQHVTARIIYFKCHKEETMRHLIENYNGAFFKYDNGNVARVAMTEENESFRYVRVWGLPPEAPNEDVMAFFGQYGEVRKVVRELFPKELNCPIETGVRGVYMDLKKDLSHFMYIRNCRIKVHYVGMKDKCHICGSTEHIRNDCPRRPTSVGSPVFRWNMVNNNGAQNSVMTNLNDLYTTTNHATTTTTTTKNVEKAAPTTAMATIPTNTTPTSSFAVPHGSQTSLEKFIKNTSTITTALQQKTTTTSEKNSFANDNLGLPSNIVPISLNDENRAMSVLSNENKNDDSNVSKVTNTKKEVQRQGRRESVVGSSVNTRSRSNSSTSSIKSGRGRSKKKKNLPVETVALGLEPEYSDNEMSVDNNV
jgi:hypothetical protein